MQTSEITKSITLLTTGYLSISMIAYWYLFAKGSFLGSLQAYTNYVLAHQYLFSPILTAIFAPIVVIMVFSLRSNQLVMKPQKFRNMSLSFGDIPFARDNTKYKSAPDLDWVLKEVPDNAQSLVKHALNTIYGHKNMPAGGTHAPLYEHTINVVKDALQKTERDELLIAACVCHDIGKIVSKLNGWANNTHPQVGAQMLARSAAYEQTDETTAQILVLTTAYHHNVSSMPELPIAPRVKNIIKQMKESDGKSTQKEREIAQESVNMPKLAFDMFVRELPEMAWQVPYQQMGKTIGYKKDGYIYIYEYVLRESVKKNCSAETVDLLGGYSESTRSMPTLTKNVLQYCVDNCLAYKDQLTTWNVKSGSVNLKCMLILKCTGDIAKAMQSIQDTNYDIEVLDTYVYAAQRKPKTKNKEKTEPKTQPNQINLNLDDDVVLALKRQKRQGKTKEATDIPDKSVPDKSVPDKSVPDKSVPDKSVPDKSAKEMLEEIV